MVTGPAPIIHRSRRSCLSARCTWRSRFSSGDLWPRRKLSIARCCAKSRTPRRLSRGSACWSFSRDCAAEAAELFGKGVALRPGSARFHANLGEALRTTDREDEAVAHLRRATELDPKLPHAWNSLALVALSREQFAESEAACREAIKHAPDLTAAYINLANALAALECPADAADALRTAPAHRAPERAGSHEPGLGPVRTK